MARKSRTFKLTRKAGLISAAALVVVIVAGLGVWHHYNRPSQEVINVPTVKNTTSAQNSSSDKSATASNSAANSASTGSNNNTTSTNTGSPTDGTGQPPASPDNSLFVSNPNPGNGKPTIENSTCNTTPGASCYIEFTLGSKTIKLQSGIADDNGYVYWNGWDVNNPDYGFTSGNWTITAVATLNGQTRTAADSQELVIP